MQGRGYKSDAVTGRGPAVQASGGFPVSPGSAVATASSGLGGKPLLKDGIKKEPPGIAARRSSPPKETPGWAWPQTSKAITEAYFSDPGTGRDLVRTTPFSAMAWRKKINKNRPASLWFITLTPTPPLAAANIIQVSILQEGCHRGRCRYKPSQRLSNYMIINIFSHLRQDRPERVVGTFMSRPHPHCPIKLSLFLWLFQSEAEIPQKLLFCPNEARHDSLGRYQSFSTRGAPGRAWRVDGTCIPAALSICSICASLPSAWSFFPGRK